MYFLSQLSYDKNQFGVNLPGLILGIMKAAVKKESERKAHWETIYQTKNLEVVNWYEAVPATSLALIADSKVSKNARIIDIGTGHSTLAAHLLDRGFKDLTLVDISETALERAKVRLGDRANQVKYIEADAAHFFPPDTYDLWHDRAVFHFLTDEVEIERYVLTAQCYLKKGGYLVLGTFSEEGPDTCSGLPVKQYSADSLTQRFERFFDKVKCVYVDHETPAGELQNFVFCLFKKK